MNKIGFDAFLLLLLRFSISICSATGASLGMTAIACERPPEPSTAPSAAFSSPSSPNNKKNRSASRRLTLLSSALFAVPPSSSTPPRSSSSFPASAVGEPVGRGEGYEESGSLIAWRRREEERGGLDDWEARDRRTVEDLEEEEDFSSPREARSVTSCCSGESSARFEFYDAVEDFVLDGLGSQPSPSLTTNDENELHALRLNLMEEVRKRKEAEITLFQLQNQWERLVECLHQVQVPFPASHQAGRIQLEIDPTDLCQEILFTRVVSEAIVRGLSQVETEATAKAVIDAKNYEISRLQDRVHYYEFVNREMTLRNQKITELARKKRLTRKTRRRWIWSCIGLSVTLGTALFAYSYLAPSVEDSPNMYHEGDAA